MHNSPASARVSLESAVEHSHAAWRSLGMRVRVIAYQGNKGQIVIRYESLADFDRVLERLAGDN